MDNYEKLIRIQTEIKEKILAWASPKEDNTSEISYAMGQIHAYKHIEELIDNYLSEGLDVPPNCK